MHDAQGPPFIYHPAHHSGDSVLDPALLPKDPFPHRPSSSRQHVAAIPYMKSLSRCHTDLSLAFLLPTGEKGLVLKVYPPLAGQLSSPGLPGANRAIPKCLVRLSTPQPVCKKDSNNLSHPRVCLLNDRNPTRTCIVKC